MQNLSLKKEQLLSVVAIYIYDEKDVFMWLPNGFGEFVFPSTSIHGGSKARSCWHYEELFCVDNNLFNSSNQ